MQTMSETVTILIGAVGFMAGLRLIATTVDGWTDPKISFACKITLHCNTNAGSRAYMMNRLS